MNAGNGPKYPNVTVHDHCFMSDRFSIDVHIALQKMFCLRIVCSAERPFDKNLQTTCRDEEPKNKAQQECERQNPGSGGGPQKKLAIF